MDLVLSISAFRSAPREFARPDNPKPTGLCRAWPALVEQQVCLQSREHTQKSEGGPLLPFVRSEPARLTYLRFHDLLCADDGDLGVVVLSPHVLLGLITVGLCTYGCGGKQKEGPGQIAHRHTRSTASDGRCAQIVGVPCSGPCRYRGRDDSPPRTSRTQCPRPCSAATCYSTPAMTRARCKTKQSGSEGEGIR